MQVNLEAMGAILGALISASLKARNGSEFIGIKVIIKVIVGH